MKTSPQLASPAAGRETGPAHDPRAIIDGLSDAVIVVDTDRRVQQANRAAGDWAGQDANSLIGRHCHEIFQCAQPCGEGTGECPLPAALSSGEPVQVTRSYLVHDSNKIRYVNVVASPLRDTHGAVVAVIEAMRDVTAERELAEALVRRNEHLSVLDSVARTLNQSLDLTDILGRALEEILHLTTVDIGAIFLRDEAMGSLELLAHRGLSEHAARLVAQLGMMDGSCGGVVEHQSLIIVPKVQRYRSQRTRAVREEQLSTLVHVPLVARGYSLGSMCVGTRQPREFDTHEQNLLTAIGNQIAVAIENARLYAELQRKEHMRGELLHKVISAQEEERKRIARELHDEISQNLTALLYAAEEAAEVSEIEEIKRLLENMRRVAQRSLDGVHKLIFDLRPAMLDHLGLAPALRWFAKSRLEPCGVRVIVKQVCDGDQDALDTCRLPPETETALFRVVQEAITNIVRHAMARTVRLTLSAQEEWVTIRIEDDGIGFDSVGLSLAPDSGRGLGLLGMQERVELVGGSIDISSTPGQGTRIHVQVPRGPGRDRSAATAGQPQEATSA